MPYPDHLERLKHISIDTLGLSESTLALLKWNGLTHVLDCIAYFYKNAQEIGGANPWPTLFRAMFGDVKPALIMAGYWDLVLDADVWQAFAEQNYPASRQSIARWQGKDQDLGKIPIEALGLSDLPPELHQYFDSNVGDCLRHFIFLFSFNSGYWLAVNQYDEYLKAVELHDMAPDLEAYQFGVLLPRLVELGYWRLIEERMDDFDMARYGQEDEER
jgi:hypothetical protein